MTLAVTLFLRPGLRGARLRDTGLAFQPNHLNPAAPEFKDLKKRTAKFAELTGNLDIENIRQLLKVSMYRW